jgi:hypothetical protein
MQNYKPEGLNYVLRPIEIENFSTVQMSVLRVKTFSTFEMSVFKLLRSRLWIETLDEGSVENRYFRAGVLNL